ncbi:hypothetical protein [Streptomyces boluensis]|uniref:Peptidoglycan binding domain-containing protein n=1 Tax=Streptomyces boluensis TaxID=1775135 RepID=A0A964UNT1_9ACTN|nr:hypothetical protein [Streptomyces boluensis]NBE52481.1 hypothetical protein [Streptomyces boluensis]
MSRETDSSSSGPQGRGGAAYPSGTPPYGQPGGDGADGADPSPWRQLPEHEAEQPATPDGPETQTTLTTRIRINIPGSRPIPPVVMRTPVGDSDSAEPAGPSSPLAGREPAGPPSGGAPAGAPSGAPSGGSGLPRRPAPGAPGAPAAPAGSTGSAGSGGESTSDWFAPRKQGKSSGATPPGGTPSGGAPSGGAPSGGAPSGGPGAPRLPAAQGGGRRGDLPYFSGPGGDNAPGTPGTSGPAPADQGGAGNPSGPRPSRFGPGPAGTPSAPAGPSGPAGPAGPTAPTGPTGGPATGDGPVLPAAFRKSAGAGGGIGAGPGAPTGPAMADDTALLNPRTGEGPPPGGRHVSGDTLTSGIPVVPAGPQSDPVFPQHGTHTPHTPPVLPDPPAPRRDEDDTPASAAPPKKKGRNKLVLIGAAVVGVTGIAYGAGLLMNHSDVPKGTTVLGVDIGGGTRDEAVKKLDAVLEERSAKALRLSIDGDEATLKPSQSGLSVNTQETVRQAAGSDYNPVSVIGSLFGAERVVDPVMPTDKEKLRDALLRVAGTSGTAAEATIEFRPGKAVPSYGRSGKSLNPQGSVTAVEAAYRTQVETGSAEPVQLPVSAADPNIPKAEVDRMMKEFATPAMSGLITVRTDAAHTVSFSPEKSIYKFVSVQPGQRGKLVPKYDLAALEALYGSAFDGVRMEMADGSKKPVTPQLVAQAVNRALVGATPAERIVQIGPQQQN